MRGTNPIWKECNVTDYPFTSALNWWLGDSNLSFPKLCTHSDVRKNVKRIIRFMMMFYWMMIASMATIPFLFFSCISCLPLRSFVEVKTTDWCFTSRCLTKDTSPTCLPSTSTNSLKYYPIIGQYYDNQNFILLLPLKNLILFVCLQPDYQISLCDDTDTDRVNEPDDAECRLCHTSCWLELAESEFSLHPHLLYNGGGGHTSSAG